MKKMTFMAVVAATALLTGCGGGGGSTPTTPSGGTNPSNDTNGSTGGATSSPISSLTLNSVDDVKGYTIRTNQSTRSAGGYTIHQTITLTIGCGGNFVETIVNSSSSNSVTDTLRGTEIDLDTSFDPYELTWHGIWDGDGGMDAGESSGDSIDMSNTNQIIAGNTCWGYYGDASLHGADCPNNLYIETITQDSVCN